MKCVFIICWFGKLPSYFDNWLISAKYNTKFDFLFFSDDGYQGELPNNVRFIDFSMEEFIQRAKLIIDKNASLNKSYRVCDFRPMYGELFKKEIEPYEYWGFCDIDLIFGDLSRFIVETDMKNNDAIFNAGHLTLIRNTDTMNSLYKKRGSLFSYRTVARNNAIFAFDEYTGIQAIAKANNIVAKYGIPYIDVDSRYTQLRSRNEIENPDNQAFYWEKGKLYRAKVENDELSYQEIAYIHLQKRTIKECKVSNSFWICPHGYVEKQYIGLPNKSDILKYNPYLGTDKMREEETVYKKNKIRVILSRNPYQIFVRIRQQMFGINDNDHSYLSQEWENYVR